MHPYEETQLEDKGLNVSDWKWFLSWNSILKMVFSDSKNSVLVFHASFFQRLTRAWACAPTKRGNTLENNKKQNKTWSPGHRNPKWKRIRPMALALQQTWKSRLEQKEGEAGCGVHGTDIFWHVQAFEKLYIQVCDRRLNVWKKLRSIKTKQMNL